MFKNEMNVLNDINSFIFKNPTNTLAYIVSRAWLSTLLGLLVGSLFALIYNLLELSTPYAKTEVEGKAKFLHLIIVILVPIFETALLVASIELLKKLKLAQALTCTFSSLFLAALHATTSWTTTVIVFLPFVIFSCSYLVFAARSRAYAFFVCYAIHAIDNAFTWSIRKALLTLGT